MSIFNAVLGVGSAISGLIGGSKKNKQAKRDYELQKKLADKQIEYGDYIQSLSKDLQGRNFNLVDPSGGTSGFDPTTNTYKTTLGPQQRQIQDASYGEELARNTIDQAIRRQGILDVEGRRQQASGDANAARTNLLDFIGGIGQVDGTRIGNQLRTDREAAINAGYDDAARAATTLGLRTGSSSVESALRNIARSRAQDRLQIGSPDIEGMQIAEGINRNRLSDRGNMYGLFTTQANDRFDTGFAPSTYDAEGRAIAQDQQKIDLSKYEIGMGGSGTAAATVGNAASGLRSGAQQRMNNTNYNLFGDFLAGIGSAASGAGLKI
jgi:hypothetical protein